MGVPFGIPRVEMPILHGTGMAQAQAVVGATTRSTIEESGGAPERTVPEVREPVARMLPKE